MGNITSLEQLEPDTLADVVPINSNFDKVREEINDNDSRISSLRSETSNNISSLNTLIQTTKKELTASIESTTDESLRLDGSNITDTGKENLRTIAFPDYSKMENKTMNTVYQAKEDGWVLIYRCTGNKDVGSYLDVGKTKEVLTRIMFVTSNVVTSSSSIYPIKKGWYYKGGGNSTYAYNTYYFVPCGAESLEVENDIL